MKRALPIKLFDDRRLIKLKMSELDAPLFGEEIATVTEEGTVFGRLFEHVPSPIDIVLRGSSRMNASASLNYSEISVRGKIAGVMDPRHLLAYLRSTFPRESNQTFEQAAPLTQRDLLRMHHAVSKSDDIVLTVRRHCILFQIDPIKAIILADRVFLFHDLQDDEHACREGDGHNDGVHQVVLAAAEGGLHVLTSGAHRHDQVDNHHGQGDGD